MAITLNGTTGITTPDVTSDGLTVDSTTLVVDEANNRVGVGTSSPSGTFVVAGSDTYPRELQVTTNDQTVTLKAKGKDALTYNGTLNLSADGAGGDIRFEINSTERARIDSSGNLLVGTTSGSGRNEILNATQSGEKCSVYVKGAATGYDNIISQVALDSGTRYHIAFRDGSSGNGGQRGSITTNGSSTSYNTSSDYRLKHDIQPLTGALAKVQALKPCAYKWNADDSADEGFIAHELQEVCPSAVTGEKDAVDAEGNPVYQGIDTSFLVATLTAAIQEQQTIIESLTARVVALEGQP